MDDSKKFYEKYGGKRYENFIGNFWFTQKHKKLVALIQYTTDKPTILDVGSGPGQLLERIRGKFPSAKLAALDISSAMVERLKERLPIADAKAGNAEILPWEDNTFDIVTNSISFHHYHNPLKALKEIYRILKPGGKFYLMDISPDFPLMRSLYNLIGIIARDGHVTFYTSGEIKLMFKQAGFNNIQQLSLGFFSRVVVSIGEKS